MEGNNKEGFTLVRDKDLHQYDADMSSSSTANSTAFMKKPLPVVEFVMQFLNRAGSSSSSSTPFSHADHLEIEKALRGVKVEVTHHGKRLRKYRITGLTSQPTQDLAFAVDDRGTMKSVVEYFLEKYGLVIQHIQWPCLQVGDQQRPNYLPMEVCKIVKGQGYSERLAGSQVTALRNVISQHPQDREHDIHKAVTHNAYAEDPYLKEFGMNMCENLEFINARILPAPLLKYHETGRQKDCLPQAGQWNMRDRKVVDGGAVNSWICINFTAGLLGCPTLRFCYYLGKMCNTLGMAFNPDPVLPEVIAPPSQVESALKKSMIKLQGKELDLLIAILPDKRDKRGSLYGDLKRICETELGIVSQCFLAKHVTRMSRRCLENVALKINVKVGGRNTVLVDALSRWIPVVSDRPTVIFGADVIHPHPGGDSSSPSIAAVVASQDWPEMAKYASLVSTQAHRQELIQDSFKTWRDPVVIGPVTDDLIKKLLISFYKATGHKPQRIIYYRNGVSER